LSLFSLCPKYPQMLKQLDYSYLTRLRQTISAE
jgi:hypothetical protein